jgi:hypothetical protein
MSETLEKSSAATTGGCATELDVVVCRRRIGRLLRPLQVPQAQPEGLIRGLSRALRAGLMSR